MAEGRGGRDGRGRATCAALLAAGLALQAFLALRGGVRGDQVVLLELGVPFAAGGPLGHGAKRMSGGGTIPGALLELLVGAPLRLWPDPRSPVVLIGLCHALAAAVLLRTLLPALGARFAAVYLAVYWLSPWRLFHAGFLWEPGFVFLPAAAHLWACHALRRAPRAAASTVLAASLALAAQLHGSFLALWLLTLLLLVGRLVRVDARGALLGAAVGFATLLPTLGRRPLAASLPADGFVGSGLLHVYPLLKAAAYWLRLGSLDLGRRLRDASSAVAAEAAGTGAGGALPLALSLLTALALASLLVPLAANAWALRTRREAGSADDPWTWFGGYARAALAATLLSAALSPVPVQGWHLVILLHAACLPVAAWIERRWSDGGDAGARRPRLERAALALFLALRVPVALVLGAHEQYRPGPRDAEARSLLRERIGPPGERGP